MQCCVSGESRVLYILLLQVSRGRCALSDGRSWQLIDCAPISTQDQGGLKALQALKRNLGDVLEVLLPQYGPGVAQQLVDTTKGYAILLRGDDKPVTAGLLDVYGQVSGQCLHMWLC